MAPVSTARLDLPGEATSALPVVRHVPWGLLVSTDVWVVLVLS